MRRTTVGASTGVLLLLAALLAACGGGENPQGYVAMGPSDTSRAPAKPVAPTDDVTLTPLDGDGNGADRAGGDAGSSGGGRNGGTGTDVPAPGDHSPAPPVGGTPHGPTPGSPDGPSPGTGDGDGDGDGDKETGSGSDSGNDGSAPSAPATGSPSPTPGDDTPALLKVSAPDLTDTEDRWCEKVTLRFRNTGGRPVRSGTLTFKTHIIGGLGIDWDTRKTTHDLPAPIPAGESKKHTWKICVAAWRVPLGMHIDTKDVDVEWK